jgi:SAM-dependent methyltransferase
MQQLRSRLAAARGSFAMLGPWLTVRYALINTLAYDPVGDQSFDRQHGTDTSGFIPPEKLDVDDTRTREQATMYIPSPPRVTSHLLRSLGIQYSRFTFVDIGSGKGRVLLVASRFPFRTVVGVEISPSLCAIARNNIASDRRAGSRRCHDVRIQEMSMERYVLPDSDTVFHLYHPFNGELLRTVLRRIEAWSIERKRSVKILYLFPADMTQAIFRELETIKVVRSVRCINEQYSWLLAANSNS